MQHRQKTSANLPRNNERKEKEKKKKSDKNGYFYALCVTRSFDSFHSPSRNDVEKKREKKTKTVAKLFALHSTAEKEKKD